jgi:hypothetical protein
MMMPREESFSMEILYKNMNMRTREKEEHTWKILMCIVFPKKYFFFILREMAFKLMTGQIEY